MNEMSKTKFGYHANRSSCNGVFGCRRQHWKGKNEEEEGKRNEKHAFVNPSRMKSHPVVKMIPQLAALGCLKRGADRLTLLADLNTGLTGRNISHWTYCTH